MPQVTISDWMMIVAVLIAPVVAVQVERFLEQRRQRNARRQWVFRTLMATRAARVSAEHVQALNSIDIEFHGRRMLRWRWQSKNEKAVTQAWKTYLDHLEHFSDAGELAVWTERGDDLFASLLHVLAQTLDYDFDIVHLKRGIYAPQAHGEEFLDQLAIRRGLARVLGGDAALPVYVFESPPAKSGEGSDGGTSGDG